jgi:hypothetical protein
MLRRVRTEKLTSAVSPFVSWLGWAASLPLLAVCVVAYVVLGLLTDLVQGDGPDDREPVEL